MAKIILDNKDYAIIRLIQADARMPFNEIARKLKVSEGTVFNRLEKLKKAGIVRGFQAVIDYELLGYEITAIMGLRVGSGMISQVEAEVSKKPEVLAVYDITGEYDAMLICRFRSRMQMNDFIKSLLTIKYVERTNTYLVLNTVKENFSINL